MQKRLQHVCTLVPSGSGAKGIRLPCRRAVMACVEGITSQKARGIHDGKKAQIKDEIIES